MRLEIDSPLISFSVVPAAATSTSLAGLLFPEPDDGGDEGLTFEPPPQPDNPSPSATATATAHGLGQKTPITKVGASDRKVGVEGKSVAVRVVLGGRRIIKKKNEQQIKVRKI